MATSSLLLGEQLCEVMSDGAVDDVVRLSVGISNALPQMLLIAKDALKHYGELRPARMEGQQNELLADLGMHKLDVALSDLPLQLLTSGSWKHIAWRPSAFARYMAWSACRKTCCGSFAPSNTVTPMLGVLRQNLSPSK